MSERNKNILLGILVVGVISMTVAFAAYTSRLKVGGQTDVTALSWNIRFENWTLDTANTVTVGGVTHNNTASYPTVAQLTQTLNPNITKVDGLTVTLNQPGDYAKYNFEIANKGTIDAKLNSMSHDMGTTNNVIDYTVDCYATSAREGTAIEVNHVLASNASVYCTLKVQYKDQTNTSTAGSNQVYEQATAITTTLIANWQWVQNESQANSGSGSGNQQVDENGCITSISGSYGYDAPGAETCGNGGTSAWVSEINPEWTAYYRNNGSYVDICVKLSTGTVCLVGNLNGYASDFQTCDSEHESEYESEFCNNASSELEIDACRNDFYNSCLSGYVGSKVNEMKAKGATCEVENDRVTCSFPNNGSIELDAEGHLVVNAASAGYYVSCYPDFGSEYGKAEYCPN